jgi:glycosyltransferase involved in cell wall biosynthesis
VATTWFDVTTILAWRRPPTGVVRVEAEVFKRLASQRRPDVKFCAYERSARQYVEHAADDVLAVLERNSTGKTTRGSPSAAKRFAEGATEFLKRAPLPVYRQFAAFKKRSTPVLRNALHQLRETNASLKALRHRVATSPREAAQGATTIFQEADVLVSAGLDWDFKDLDVLYQLKRSIGFRVVLFCYDLIPVLLPHACRTEVADAFPRYFADVAWCADTVLCISKSSQRDFEAFIQDIGAPKPRTGLVHLGSTLHTPDVVGGVEHLVREPFILFVSTIERRKNHEVLYRALVRLAEQGRPLPTLVFVGMQGWGVEDLMNDLKRDPRVRSKIVLLHHVTDAELAALYRKARFTVFPSLYEGWGLPVAESLAHGRFCLSSNTSSLPEVGGELVEYLDPWDVNGWADRIAFYVEHPEAVAKREQTIRECFTPTSWEETAKTVLASALALNAAG